MKWNLLLVFVISLAVSCGQNGSKKEQNITSSSVGDRIDFALPNVVDCGYKPKLSDSEGWELVFEDDFENDYTDNWSSWRGGAYNEELQYYQAENVFVENGFLYLYGKREKVQGRTRPDDEKIKNFDFTSARLESKKLFGPKNMKGKKTIKFSARLRLLEGEGLWPAWWSYGHPWPTEGELDILEARGNRPYEFSSCFHYGEKPSITETDIDLNVFEYKHSEKLSECFHVYDLEWSENSFKILFDGVLIKVYDSEHFPFVRDFWEKEHMLCLNLAIGGIFFDTYEVSKIPDESFYVIDWVKVYNK